MKAAIKAFFWVCFIGIAPTLSAKHYRLRVVDTHVPASFRGLSVVNNKVAWVSGTKGYVGVTQDGAITWAMHQVPGYEHCDFRSLFAFNKHSAIMASAGVPAVVLFTDDGGATWRKVLSSSDTSVFFDGIAFWDRKNGLIYGDPLNGRLQLLLTTDGGHTWHQGPDSSAPKMEVGEASFAASGTTIRLFSKKKVMIATGGRQSRLLVSDDLAEHWTSLATPMLQGEPTEGVFSMAFKHNGLGIIVGGDYKRDTLAEKNAYYSSDWGRTWHQPRTTTRGYRECAEFLSKHSVLAAGPSGIDVSYNWGVKWQSFSDEAGFHVVRKARQGRLVLLAGANGKVGVVEK